MSASDRRRAARNAEARFNDSTAALLQDPASRGLTPWNPSRRATARVKDPLPAPTICRYCGSRVELVHNSQIYGTAYGQWPWAFLCTDKTCRAYVGLHPFTSIPLGTLADAETRRARHLCKAVFMPLWHDHATRTQAYQWLAGALGIPVSECHVGWFDAAQCFRAIELINNRTTRKEPPTC